MSQIGIGIILALMNMIRTDKINDKSKSEESIDRHIEETLGDIMLTLVEIKVLLIKRNRKLNERNDNADGGSHARTDDLA